MNREAEFLALFEEFRGLPARRPTTLLELTGYAQRELLVSRLLAFFLDPSGLHGLGSLFLDALLECIGVSDETPSGAVDVYREVHTEEGKSIDIMVSTPGLLLGIENKVFSPVGNPFEEYADHLRKEAWGRTPLGVLLTLWPAPEVGGGFKRVGYSELIQRIRDRLGRYCQRADGRFLLHAVDFLTTLEGLMGQGSITAESMEFARKNATVLRDIRAFTDEVLAELTRQAKAAMELVDETKIPGEPRKALYPGQNGKLLWYLYFEFGAFPRKPVVDAMVTPDGWRFVCKYRVGPPDELSPMLAAHGFTAKRLFEDKQIVLELDDDISGWARADEAGAFLNRLVTALGEELVRQTGPADVPADGNHSP